MNKRFPDEYARYRERVPRLGPGLRVHRRSHCLASRSPALLRPLGRALALGSLELGGQSEAGEDLGHDERSDLLDQRALEREDVDRQR